jgi:hypothetical protein
MPAKPPDKTEELTRRIDAIATTLADLSARLSALEHIETVRGLPVQDAIAQLRQAGLKPVEIADELRRRGYATPRGAAYGLDAVLQFIRKAARI